jgi:hypothetical protein
MDLERVTRIGAMGVLEMKGQRRQDVAPLFDTRMLGSLFQGIKRFQAGAHEIDWFGGFMADAEMMSQRMVSR